MVDKLPPAARSENMRRIRSKGMKPELIVRKLVYSMGFRYRLHLRDLPGRPDLVFSSRRKVIFVHGCFWHQHPDKGCLDARMPKSNVAYWEPKLKKNIERDAAVKAALQDAGWQVHIVWECETKNIHQLAESLRSFLL